MLCLGATLNGSTACSNMKHAIEVVGMIYNEHALSLGHIHTSPIDMYIDDNTKYNDADGNENNKGEGIRRDIGHDRMNNL